MKSTSLYGNRASPSGSILSCAVRCRKGNPSINTCLPDSYLKIHHGMTTRSTTSVISVSFRNAVIIPASTEWKRYFYNDGGKVCNEKRLKNAMVWKLNFHLLLHVLMKQTHCPIGKLSLLSSSTKVVFGLQPLCCW